jgi:hypothetical protein
MWGWLAGKKKESVNPLDVRNVIDKETFFRFVAALRDDFDSHADQWQNGSVPSYLDAIGAWSKSWKKLEKSPNPWRHAAMVLWAGRIYE